MVQTHDIDIQSEECSRAASVGAKGYVSLKFALSKHEAVHSTIGQEKEALQEKLGTRVIV